MTYTELGLSEEKEWCILDAMSTYKYLRTFFPLLSVVLVNTALAGEKHDQYVENINEYINSIQSISYEAEFTGTTRATVEKLGKFTYDTSGSYEILSDPSRQLWKASIIEEQVPQGKLSQEDFGIAHIDERRTIAKGPRALAEYIHREKEGGNLMVFHDSQSPAREKRIELLMRRIDPLRYIRFAVPDARVKLENLTETSELAVLKYKDVKGNTRVVELSKAHDGLPVKIYVEGFENEAYLEFSYLPGKGRPIVDKIVYRRKTESGTVTYRNVIYNPRYEDNDFEIELPSDAVVIDRRAGGIVLDPAEREIEIEESIDTLVGTATAPGTMKSAKILPPNDVRGEEVLKVPPSLVAPVVQAARGHFIPIIVGAVAIVVLIAGLVVRSLGHRRIVK